MKVVQWSVIHLHVCGLSDIWAGSMTCATGIHSPHTLQGGGVMLWHSGMRRLSPGILPIFQSKRCTQWCLAQHDRHDVPFLLISLHVLLTFVHTSRRAMLRVCHASSSAPWQSSAKFALGASFGSTFGGFGSLDSWRMGTSEHRQTNCETIKHN